MLPHLGNAILLQPLPETWLDIYHTLSELPDFMNDRETQPFEERELL